MFILLQFGVGTFFFFFILRSIWCVSGREGGGEVLLPWSSTQADSASLLCKLPFTIAVLICLAPSGIFECDSNSPFVCNEYSVFLVPLQSCLRFSISIWSCLVAASAYSCNTIFCSVVLPWLQCPDGRCWLPRLWECELPLQAGDTFSAFFEFQVCSPEMLSLGNSDRAWPHGHP